MKNRTDNILLAVFLLSLPVYIFLLLTYLEIISMELPSAPLYSLRAWLAFTFPVVPVFCLQLLLCRRARRRVAVIPTLVIAGAALRFACGYFTATGWDNLGWLILLCLSIAPVVGCVLAWAAYGLCQLSRKGDVRHAD